jgi:hypothetical protein
MNASLKALRSLINNYNPALAPSVFPELEEVFLSRDPFLEKVKRFDKTLAAHPEFAPVEEYAFDLLMAFHLEDKQDNEDYFDTKEWMDIEDKTLERGTELLNLLLYITEAKDNEVSVELEDFLNEFLLIEEDEFQDEYKIYEDLISNVELVEEPLELIIETAERMDINPEMKDLFVPLLLFFKNPNVTVQSAAALQPMQHALLGALHTFYNN